MQYNYTIQVEKSAVDTIALLKIGKAGLLDLLKKNTKAKYFKENNIEIQANYADKDGIQICKIVVLPNEY